MTPLAAPMTFALAGNAVFTLQSVTTKTRFTYRVRKAPEGPMHFVQVLTGPNNAEDWKYLGYIRRGVFFHGGAKAKIGREAPSAKAFDWFWRNLARGGVSTTVEVFHEGRCGRCARPLTVPESIQSGFGPECAGKLAL